MSDLSGALKAGYAQFVSGGQYLGLFLIAILFLWLSGKERIRTMQSGLRGRGRAHGLFAYILCMTALICFPLTAWVLLKYQTAFYTYSHLFLLLPVTLTLAWALTEAVAMVSDYLAGQRESAVWAKKYPGLCEGTGMLIGVCLLVLAGTVKPAAEVTARTENNYKVPGAVLEVLGTLETSDQIDLQAEILLAPDEVMEYARSYSGEFRLLYGRNLWNKSLDAYTYDTYPETYYEIHDWLNPGSEIVIVPGIPAVGTNLSMEDAVRMIEESGCTLLILTKGQYEEPVIADAVEKNSAFVWWGETKDYVILKKS